jgi:phosphoglycolate phosphatase-like HAD superfamily hydrolase
MTGPGHKPAKLAVFDVDGTLTQTYDDDIEAFTGAVRQAFGFEGVSDDWSGYRHVTDSGILDELIRDRLGRPATPDDQGAAEAAYGQLYGATVAARGVQAVPGAPAFVRRLSAGGDWAVAAATGAWRATAELRLREADIGIDPACVATASEHMARRDIVQLAIERAAAHWGLAEGPEGFARVVLLGDGLWDVKTARALGFPFVGIGQGAAAARLEAAGAGCIAADFIDGDRLLRLLEAAIVPTL